MALKKAILVIVVFAVCLTLCACGKKVPDSDEIYTLVSVLGDGKALGPSDLEEANMDGCYITRNADGSGKLKVDGRSKNIVWEETGVIAIGDERHSCVLNSSGFVSLKYNGDTYTFEKMTDTDVVTEQFAVNGVEEEDVERLPDVPTPEPTVLEPDASEEMTEDEKAARAALYEARLQALEELIAAESALREEADTAAENNP